MKEDSDSGVVINDVDSENRKIGRSVSEVTRGREDSTLNDKDIKTVDVGDKNQKRLYLNHRSVTRLKDLKYKRISKTHSRSLEELRLKLRFGKMCGSSLYEILLLFRDPPSYDHMKARWSRA